MFDVTWTQEWKLLMYFDVLIYSNIFYARLHD